MAEFWCYVCTTWFYRDHMKVIYDVERYRRYHLCNDCWKELPTKAQTTNEKIMLLRDIQKSRQR